jgi:hypothetical protein
MAEWKKGLFSIISSDYSELGKHGQVPDLNPTVPFSDDGALFVLTTESNLI